MTVKPARAALGQQQLGQLQVGRRRDLEVPRRPGTTSTAAAGPLDQPRVIGRAPRAARRRPRAARARARRGGTPAASGPPTARDARASAATVRPSAPTSLIVSDTGAAAITASAPDASSCASARSNSALAPAGGPHRGRPPDPRSPQARSASRTDCDRTAPPATATVPAGAASSASAGSATTICSIRGIARSVATLHSSIGLPASVTSALGRPDPRRSPRPAATINATAIRSAALVLFRRRP